MQSVLDAPMPADEAGDLGRRPGIAGEVVVGGTRPLPAHLPLPVHLDDRRHVRPVGRDAPGFRITIVYRS